jgi:hypothetical protein
MVIDSFSNFKNDGNGDSINDGGASYGGGEKE